MDEQVVEQVAAALHENWREQYRREHGDTPRLKQTSDTLWAGRNGTDQVDIAAVAFADLPGDWREENRNAAVFVTDFLARHPDPAAIRSTPVLREAAGAAIHMAWLERAEWARGGHLDVPFDRLPREEQDKDLVHLDVALDVLGF